MEMKNTIITFVAAFIVYFIGSLFILQQWENRKSKDIVRGKFCPPSNSVLKKSLCVGLGASILSMGLIFYLSIGGK
jgi:hypothetical protein